MPNFPKRAKAAAETRARIIKVARKLFTDYGFEAVTLRRVALAAGHSTGAIFSHWNGKDDLFAEAMGRPHLTDARGAELLDELRALSLVRAEALLTRWAA